MRFFKSKPRSYAPTEADNLTPIFEPRIILEIIFLAETNLDSAILWTFWYFNALDVIYKTDYGCKFASIIQLFLDFNIDPRFHDWAVRRCVMLMIYINEQDAVTVWDLANAETAVDLKRLFGVFVWNDGVKVWRQHFALEREIYGRLVRNEGLEGLVIVQMPPEEVDMAKIQKPHVKRRSKVWNWISHKMRGTNVLDVLIEEASRELLF